MSATVAVIGAGAIGTTLAYTLALRGAGLEIVIANRDEKKAWAKAFDISQCLPESPASGIRPGGIEDCAGASAVVLTLGALPKADGSRADVLRDNVGIYRSLLPRLAELCPDATFLVVTNPVDAMAFAAYRIAGLPPDRIIGSGTALDALRLRAFAGEAYGLEAGRLAVEVVGEHGDTMVPLWSGASYGGRPLAAVLSGADFGEEARAALLQRVKRAGWDIRAAGEHSTYGIAFSAARVVEAILGLREGPLLVSARCEGMPGLEGAFLSLPTDLGRGRWARHLPGASAAERESLLASAKAVLRQMEAVDRLLASAATQAI